jgi:hypothetical protein
MGDLPQEGQGSSVPDFRQFLHPQQQVRDLFTQEYHSTLDTLRQGYRSTLNDLRQGCRSTINDLRAGGWSLLGVETTEHGHAFNFGNDGRVEWSGSNGSLDFAGVHLDRTGNRLGGTFGDMLGFTTSPAETILRGSDPITGLTFNLDHTHTRDTVGLAGSAGSLEVMRDRNGTGSLQIVDLETGNELRIDTTARGVFGDLSNSGMGRITVRAGRDNSVEIVDASGTGLRVARGTNGYTLEQINPVGLSFRPQFNLAAVAPRPSWPQLTLGGETESGSWFNFNADARALSMAFSAGSSDWRFSVRTAPTGVVPTINLGPDLAHDLVRDFQHSRVTAGLSFLNNTEINLSGGGGQPWQLGMTQTVGPGQYLFTGYDASRTLTIGAEVSPFSALVDHNFGTGATHLHFLGRLPSGWEAGVNLGTGSHGRPEYGIQLRYQPGRRNSPPGQ